MSTVSPPGRRPIRAGQGGDKEDKKAKEEGGKGLT